MDSTSRNVQYSTACYDPAEGYIADVYRLQNGLRDNCFASSMKFNAKTTFSSVLDELVNIVKEIVTYEHVYYEYYSSNHASVQVYDSSGKWVMFARIGDYYRDCNQFEDRNREFLIQIAGIPTLAIPLAKQCVKFETGYKLPRVTWHYNVGGRSMFKPILVDKPHKALDEFYPWLKTSIRDYFKSYMESEANILIMLGPPGTGKTSLIRNLIYDYKLNTSVTYDEELLHSDSFFVNYLTDDDMNLLVVEDADVFLQDRTSAGNKVMAKLLNVSDGIIKVLDKKMIFTANLTDPKQIDQALLRPGRSFDVVTFRELTFEETVKAAETAGIDIPTEDRKYTLAEMFNRDRTAVRNTDHKKGSFGFI